jgi:hypothetical protein
LTPAYARPDVSYRLQAELILILIHKTLSRAAPQNTEPVSPPAGILAARREHLTGSGAVIVNQRTIWLRALTACGVVAILLVSIIVVPKWLYPPLGAADLRGVLSAQVRIQLQQAQSQLANDARSSVLQALGGPQNG